jgi:prepilin-type N-terminal cleavage/methylation domain-containing protein
MTKQKQHKIYPSRDGGYTIIESLVAMIVVSVLMIAIAPVMAFSVATRVQARRTELGHAGGENLHRRFSGRGRYNQIPGFPIPVTSKCGRCDVPTDNDHFICVDMDRHGDCIVPRAPKTFTFKALG